MFVGELSEVIPDMSRDINLSHNKESFMKPSVKIWIPCDLYVVRALFYKQT